MVVLIKIVKYKKGTKGRYLVFLEDGRELSFYEEVILKFDLLLHKEIDTQTMILADQYNQEWDVYYVALHSIESHFKTVYELRIWLQKKEYPDELIEKAISKLIEQGYLNDQVYARSYIHTQLITTNKGPYRLIRDLEDKGVDSSFIGEEIETFTEEMQEERIRKVIDKELRSNRTKGGIVLKQKICNDLKNLGYDISMVHQVIHEYSFDDCSDLAKKEYEKLMRKYSRTYQGEELKRVVRDKMYRKGFTYEDE